MRPREILLSLAISFGSLILGGIFNIIEIRFELGITQSVEGLTLDQLVYDYGLLSVQYDLLLISLGLILTANFSMEREEQHRLNSAWAVLYGGTLLVLGSIALSPEISTNTIVVRNGLALFTIGWSAHIARVG